MSDIKYSIVIPVLNEEGYIGALLDCLSAQTLSDFEVLIIDGGSTDNTEQVVDEHKNGLQLQFVKSPKKGVSFQRNYGASLAQSDRLMFMDADVYFEEDFLYKIEEYLLKNSDIDILSTWLIPNTDKRLYKLVFKIYNRATDIAKRWIPVSVGAFMYCKKETFLALKGFNEDMNVTEDWDFVIRAHRKRFKFALLHNPKIYFSIRRMEKMGKTRYLLMSSRTALYFPLRSIFKKVDIVNYWNIDKDSSWKKKSINKYTPKDSVQRK
jgi:glycosyltransferase involved in cell wall biosynthesis